ncbi:MAG: hypothetical protein ACP5O2_11345 [Bacteroidales bacterium]
MTLEERIQAFVDLGRIIRSVVGEKMPQALSPVEERLAADLRFLIEDHLNTNPWFDPFHVRYALQAIASMLGENELRHWAAAYPGLTETSNQKVALIMAGNLPAVGFHDFLSVLLAGHSALIRLSSEDRWLIPWMANCLTTLYPRFSPFIHFFDEPLRGFDAVIATGSNNSARYFEYYFGKYPHIIRRNMNAVAVISGNEAPDELEGIVDDILLYYGRGCRSVSQLLVPADYDWGPILKALYKYDHYSVHFKFFNNYEYNKAVMLVNKVPHLDTGFLLLTENASINSPLAVVHYLRYHSLEEIESYLKHHSGQIQCVSTALPLNYPHVQPGTTQMPALTDYADRIDTMSFLCDLKNFAKNL